MRKSPLVIAMALALYGTLSHAADTFDKALGAAATERPELKINMEELGDWDKNMTAAKRSALTGALYEEQQLKDLRKLIQANEVEKVKEKTLRKEMPLEPSEISDLRKRLAKTEKAVNEPIYGDTSFRIRNITYNPDSNLPLSISLAPGYSAQVEFYDSSGKPWPIRKDGVVGDSESFSKRVMGEDRHIASFSLNRSYKESNAAVILEGLPASIPVLLKGTAATVDGRITVTLPRLGPNAEIMPIYQNEIENVSPELVKLQGGNAPTGSKALRVAGIVNAESWFDGTYLYLSLPGRLLLPPPLSSSVSPTGRYLYKVNPTPMITVSVNGERKTGTIERVYETEIRRARSVFDKENNK